MKAIAKRNLLVFCGIIMSIISIFSLFGLSFKYLTIFAFLTMLLFLDFSNSMALFVYMLPFANLFRRFSMIMFLGSLILAAKAILLFKKDRWDNKSKLFKTLFIICFTYIIAQILALFDFSDYFRTRGPFYSVLTFYSLLLLFYFSYGKLSHRKMVLAFVYGTIVSVGLSIFLTVVNLVEFSTVFAKESATIVRLSGFTQHANTLERFAILGIAFLVSLIMKNPKDWKLYLLSTILLVIGFATFSKTFLILLLVLAIFVFCIIFSKSKNKKRVLKYCLFVLIVSGVICIICFPFFKALINRFFMFYKDSSVIDMLTTGRLSIWKLYIKDMFSSPLKVIFGSSLLSGAPNTIGTHNTYLTIFYSGGIIGTIIFVIFVTLIMKNCTNWPKNIYRWLPLVLVLLAGLMEDQLYRTGFYFIGVVLILTASRTECAAIVNEKEILKEQFYLFLKRTFDICVSFIALIVFAIPMVIVGTLVKVTSKGPVFFKDKRIGKDGKTIVVLKFRSMYIDAESRIEQLLTKEQYEMWKRERKVDNDPRITKIGKIIRKTSLDELPQLINIFKGDLSIVGNRPLSKLEHETHFSKEEREKLNSMRPGLTGYWQVYGRSGVEFSGGKRQKMYLHYANNANIWLDIKLFILTFWVVLTKKGAK